MRAAFGRRLRRCRKDFILRAERLFKVAERFQFSPREAILLELTDHDRQAFRTQALAKAVLTSVRINLAHGFERSAQAIDIGRCGLHLAGDPS